MTIHGLRMSIQMILCFLTYKYPHNNSNNELTETTTNHSYWRPCVALRRILSHLTNDDFAQLDTLSNCPFPESPLTSHPHDPIKIAVCSGCKSHPDGRLSRRLAS